MSCCLLIALPEILCCPGTGDREDDLSFRTATNSRSQSFGSSASARVFYQQKDPLPGDVVINSKKKLADSLNRPHYLDDDYADYEVERKTESAFDPASPRMSPRVVYNYQQQNRRVEHTKERAVVEAEKFEDGYIQYYSETDFTNTEYEDEVQPSVCRLILLLAAPTMADLLGSWFIFGGSLWTPASTVSMMGGLLPIFVALQQFLWDRSKLPSRNEFYGMIFIAAGAFLVGLARHWGGNAAGADSSDLAELGLAFVVTSSLLYALEALLTEKLLHQYTNSSTFFQVGIMGLWGLAFFVVIFPVIGQTKPAGKPEDALFHEQFSESLFMVQNNYNLRNLILTLLLCLFTLNVGLFQTIKYASAFESVVLMMIVPFNVWILDVAAFYLLGWNVESAAEPLDNYSFLQLTGFLILVIGTCLSHGIIPPIWPFTEIQMPRNVEDDRPDGESYEEDPPY